MKHSEAGKGGTPRPFEVDHQTFSNNWDLIWKKPKKEESDSKKKDVKDEPVR